MKPEYYPLWATEDVILPVAQTPNKIEPTDQLVETGYDLGQQPRAEHWNYQWNLIGAWIEWLDTSTPAGLEIGEDIGDIPDVIDARDNQFTYSTRLLSGSPSMSIVDLGTSWEIDWPDQPFSGDIITTPAVALQAGKMLIQELSFTHSGSGGTIDLTFAKNYPDITDSGLGIRFTGNGNTINIAGTSTVVFTHTSPIVADGNTVAIVMDTSTGEITLYFNGVSQGVVTSASLTGWEEVSLRILGGGPMESSITGTLWKFSGNHEYAYDYGNFDSITGDKIDVPVPGYRPLDSRRLSPATSINRGVVKVAPDNSFNRGVPVDPESVALMSQVIAKIEDMFVGSIQMFSDDKPEGNGWLNADGQEILRDEYPTYFGKVGTTYGVGNGTTTFNIPDMRGLVPRALDQGRGFDPGRTLGSYQEDQMPEHTHEIQSSSYSGDYTVSGGSVSVGTGDSGVAGTGTEVRVKNLALKFMIYVGKN